MSDSVNNGAGRPSERREQPMMRPGGLALEEVRAVLLLDLSEAENGRISWKVNEEWETGDFAGKTVNEAMP